ncbi:MAG TPA: hypothetical protein VFM65_10220 [Flavobacteriaceae bacterium]|nr:hypothetical protein [Flavobacteriaceae bacterium]
MRKITFGILFLIIAGCKNFEAKKVSSEEVLHQKLEHFRWNEVDVYPAFENCRHLMEKPAMERCFENTLTRAIYAKLTQKPLVLGDSISETVTLYLLVSATGAPKIDSVVISKNLQQQLPELETRLRSSIDSLPKIYPATKRGIPVATKFNVPIKVVSE